MKEQGFSVFCLQKKLSSLLLFALVFLVHPCFGQTASEPIYSYDHLLIFTNDHTLKDSLDAFLTPAKKLTTVHENQGTKGYYYLFYNTFIELLFIDDSTKIVENQERFGSNYLIRWNSAEQGCPFGLGLTMNPWIPERVEAEFHEYRSEDARDEEFYLMAKGNQLESQPMIYVSMPQRAYEGFESLDEVDQIAEEFKRKDLKNYLQHPSEIKKLSSVEISVANSKGSNLELINSLEVVTIHSEESAAVILLFDEGKQGLEKSFPITEKNQLVFQY